MTPVPRGTFSLKTRRVSHVTPVVAHNVVLYSVTRSSTVEQIPGGCQSCGRLVDGATDLALKLQTHGTAGITWIALRAVGGHYDEN